MSYPMNEFVTDLEQAGTTDKPRPSPAGAVENVLHDAGYGISSLIRRCRTLCKQAGRRVGGEATAANAALHVNPYPTVLAGIGAGALLGFLVASRIKKGLG